MTKLEYSQFGRQKCGHKIVPLNGPGGSGYGACFDDVYHMNPRKLLSIRLIGVAECHFMILLSFLFF